MYINIVIFIIHQGVFMKNIQCFLLLIAIFWCKISLNAAQENHKKTSQEFLYGDTPANILLFWSYGLNYEKYEQHRHILEHVYNDCHYVQSDSISRRNASDQCMKGTCGVVQNKAFKIYPRHLIRQGFDRMQFLVNQDEAFLCVLCKPHNGDRNDL